MARGDVAISTQVPPEIDTLIKTLADRFKISRKEVLIKAILLLSESK